MSLLHRMILWELAKVFALSLLGITGLLLMAGIVAEASQPGLGPAQIIAILLLRKEKKIDQPRVEYALFVQRVQGEKLINPIFKHRSKKGGFDSVLVAREAVLQVDQSNRHQVLVHLRSVTPWTPDGASGTVAE